MPAHKNPGYPSSRFSGLVSRKSFQARSQSEPTVENERYTHQDVLPCSASSCSLVADPSLCQAFARKSSQTGRRPGRCVVPHNRQNLRGLLPWTDTAYRLHPKSRVSQRPEQPARPGSNHPDETISTRPVQSGMRSVRTKRVPPLGTPFLRFSVIREDALRFASETCAFRSVYRSNS
jgi:hypothetical protein